MHYTDFPADAWDCKDEKNVALTNGGNYESLYKTEFKVNCTYNKIFPMSDLVLYENTGTSLNEIQKELGGNAAFVDNRFSLLIIIQQPISGDKQFVLKAIGEGLEKEFVINVKPEGEQVELTVDPTASNNSKITSKQKSAASTFGLSWQFTALFSALYVMFCLDCYYIC